MNPVLTDPGAAETGPGATLPFSPPTTVISVLGRFEVRHRRKLVTVPPGLPSTAMKYVALNHGRVRTEALIDTLWPHCGLEDGRKGVRNLLSRLQRSGVPLLEREGDAIRVPRETQIDAVAFQVVADRVLHNVRHPGAVDGARLALDHYAGDLLPDDLALEWTSGPREALRRRRLALIDLLASAARRRGAKREAVTLMEMAIEVEPYDDLRYLEVAEMLLEAGRRSLAAVYVHRSLKVLHEYGLQPGPDWKALQRRIHDPGPDENRRPSGDESMRSRSETSVSHGVPTFVDEHQPPTRRFPDDC